MVAGLVVALGLTGILVGLNRASTGMVTVPNVTSLHQAEALSLLAKDHLMAKIALEPWDGLSPPAPPLPGTVIGQLPAPGSRIRSGSRITIDIVTD